MIRLFHFDEGRLAQSEVYPSVAALPPGAVWIDMIEPTKEEKAAVERLLALEVPTREEMQEIEASSRIYIEGAAAVMTAQVLSKSSSEHPESAAVTFMLLPQALVTLRYSNPQPFEVFARRAIKQPALAETPRHVLLNLLDAICDRLADVIELSTADLDAASRQIFARDSLQSADDQREILRRLGRSGDLATRARESLMELSRMVIFLGADAGAKKELKARAKTLGRDIASIAAHADFVAGKVNFLLDATLGLINIQQNSIIKIFTVAAVAFLPPTLIASIYGMNFERMPELQWPLGYPFALLLMLISAALPFAYFKRKKWL